MSPSGQLFAIGTVIALGIGAIVVLPEKTREYEQAQVTPSTGNSELKSEVEVAVEGFRRAMVERRPDLILSYASPKLTFGHSNGVVQTREEFAEVVRSGAEVFKRVDLTDKNLTVVGNTAIERHHFSADIVYQGKLMNFELEVVEVWQKTDRWRLVARQAVKV